MRSLLATFFILSVMMTELFAQTYPLVTLQDIQRVPDSLFGVSDPPSVIQGDTVRVRGVIMVRPVVDPATDRRRIIAAGGRWHTYLMDENRNVFGGIALLQHDTSIANHNTFFDLVDTAQVVEFTGVVNEFSTTTQFDILVNPAVPVNVISQLTQRPAPLELQITDFMENGQLKLTGEQYEGMYVVIRNVISSDRNTSNGTFKINDGQGNSMFMYDQSGYFTTRAHRLTGLTTYQAPNDGSAIQYIRGVIQSRADGYYITPMYPGDIMISATPPNVTNIRRDAPTVSPNQAVVITSRVIDLDGFVTSAKLHYSTSASQNFVINMTRTVADSNIFQATIPGINSDSSIISYYVVATDNDNRVAVNPTDTVRSKYFYLVLNRPLTIKDIQYSPFGGNFGGYTSYKVSVTGVVTSDTSDIPGFGSTALRVHIQDGAGPWSGIQINGATALNLRRGDNVTVSGTVIEDFSYTRIDTITQIIVNSSNNPLPDALEVTTRTIGTQPSGTLNAEQYEGVLIKYKNVTVTDDNADGNSGTTNNFGEIFVADTSGINTRVELQDGNHKYHNLWDSTFTSNPGLVRIIQGSTVTELAGVLYFSFSNYKLTPRKDDDFNGLATDVSENYTVSGYALNQNYPNPFNPATTISYSLKTAGHAKIDVYNTLGQLVTTLVDFEQTPGEYKVIFDASKLASGLYMYQMTVDNFVITKKMILIK
ncbi:MAG: T9SS type A sorting domain-containing protein [Ignavibacteriaceae bacterium]|nr:T9SS type A sorting domain-containing protein [Ignavibacteriaceae bacterium]